MLLKHWLLPAKFIGKPKNKEKDRPSKLPKLCSFRSPAKQMI